VVQVVQVLLIILQMIVRLTLVVVEVVLDNVMELEEQVVEEDPHLLNLVVLMVEPIQVVVELDKVIIQVIQ
jgi:hypothetical protein